MLNITADFWNGTRINERPDQPASPSLATFARRWSGASAPTVTFRSASDLPLPPCRFSSRCHCFRNVIAGQEQALLLLDETTRGQREEMRLRAALGMSMMMTRGSVNEARVAMEQGLALAEVHGDIATQQRLLGTLYMFHSRIGDYHTGLRYARRGSAVSKIAGDHALLMVGHCMLDAPRSTRAGLHDETRAELRGL